MQWCNNVTKHSTYTTHRTTYCNAPDSLLFVFEIVCYLKNLCHSGCCLKILNASWEESGIYSYGVSQRSQAAMQMESAPDTLLLDVIMHINIPCICIPFCLKNVTPLLWSGYPGYQCCSQHVYIPFCPKSVTTPYISPAAWGQVTPVTRCCNQSANHNRQLFAYTTLLQTQRSLNQLAGVYMITTSYLL